MGVIVDVLWSQAEVRHGLLIALVVAVSVALMARSRGRRWVALAGLTLAVGGVLAVTLSRPVISAG